VTTAGLEKLTVATRGSALALWQAHHVSGLVSQRGLATELLILKTTADRVQDRMLHEIGGKGLFIRELEQALLDRRADFAVHSLKDMPARVLSPFTLPAILPRHAPTDVLILRRDVAARYEDLKGPLSAEDVDGLGALTIGTGSLRRQALLARHAKRLKAVGLRGNVDTRLKKLASGEPGADGAVLEGIILAEASLDRLQIRDVAAYRLAPDWFVPSASQGALALESVAGAHESPEARVTAWLAEFNDAPTARAVAVEREMLARLGGDCTMPVGVHVSGTAANWTARAVVLARDGDAAEASHTGPLATDGDRARFLDELTAGLKAAGAGRILAKLGLAVPEAFA
jgi:hydroxymethylbilane synthase